MANAAGNTGGLKDTESALNLLQLWTRSASLPIELFVRQIGSWGPKYLGMGAVFGLAWPVCFAMLYGPHPDQYWVLRFWYAMVGMLVLHNVVGLIRRYRGYKPHTCYIGDSWFERMKGCTDPRRARAFEVLMATTVSLVLFQVVKPLGAFLLLGTAAHAFNLVVLELSMTARLRALQDAQIENEYVMARYRELQKSR
jgi:hypothetical protein